MKIDKSIGEKKFVVETVFTEKLLVNVSVNSKETAGDTLN